MPTQPRSATANETPIIMYRVVLLLFGLGIPLPRLIFGIGIANSGTFHFVMFHFILNEPVNFGPRL